MQNILITGGAGFIGSNLALELQRRYPDANILILDDFRSGNFKNLREYRGDFIATNVGIGDGQLGSLSKTKWDVIFHLASTTDTTDTDQNKVVGDNVEGFRNILTIAVISGAKLVYASSAATYGIRLDTNSIKESDPASPMNPYAFSKMILDNIAGEYFNDYPVIGLRFFNVYGPNEGLKVKNKTASMVSQLLYKMRDNIPPTLFPDGNQKRDFVYVKDVVDMLITCGEKAEAGKTSGIYNVGSGNAVSFNQVTEALNRKLGKNLETLWIDNPYAHFFQNFTQADMFRAEMALGFKPKWDLESGLDDYLKSPQ